MTQLDLAEKLNYSDKAVSKWERGESLPDITVIKSIADLFEVTVDYLISEEHQVPTPAEPTSPPPKKISQRTASAITGMSVLLVLLIATFLFFILCYTLPEADILYRLLPFIFGVPAASIVWLVLNSIWFNRRRNYLIISLLMWSLLASVQLAALAGGALIWQIYFLGIPGQIIILLWSKLQYKK